MQPYPPRTSNLTRAHPEVTMPGPGSGLRASAAAAQAADVQRAVVHVSIIAQGGSARRRLAGLVRRITSLRLAGAYPSPEAAHAELVGRESPVVVIRPEAPGLAHALVREMKFLAEAAAIVVYSASLDAASIFSLLAAGARACITESAPPEQFELAIFEAARDRVFLCRRAQWLAFEHLRRIASEPGREELTETERKVCVALAARPEKAVASAMDRNPKTVHSHVERIYRKLETSGREKLLARLCRRA